ncbi:hypothetical protein [Mesorhizobium sp. URHB0026]
MTSDDARVDELELDLRFMETLRMMKANFVAAVVSASKSDEPSVLFALRQEPLYQLAEFLFAIRSYGVDSADRVEKLAMLHNDYVLALRSDRDRTRRLGLRVDRLDEALFTGNNLGKLVANFTGDPPAFDQSDLARLLVAVMSTETCRKLAVAGEKAGFLERRRLPYGAVLVSSCGALEDIFGEVLRGARNAIIQY